MDTITHSLLGGVVVRTIFPAGRSRVPLSNRQRLVIGALAAAFPDIDYVGAWVDPMIYLTLWHRSITHSLVLLPFWAMFIGMLSARLFHQREAWRYISLLASVAMFSHILSDLITVFGTQILAPLSTWRASIGTTFIIDPWFTAIVLTGFILYLKERPWRPAPWCLIVLAAYLALQGTMKRQALHIAADHASRLGLREVQLTALPQPFSPFNWKLIIRQDDRYEVAYVNLSGAYRIAADETGFWADVRRTYRAATHPQWQVFYRYGDDPAAIDWVRGRWADDQLYYFRQFAQMPILYRIDKGEARHCVWFTDLRYVLPFMTPPFRYGLCRTPGETRWRLYRLSVAGQEQAL